MSEIQKKSKTVEDLEFLNSEIGKQKVIQKELEDSLVNLGLIQKKKEEEYKQAEDSRIKKIILLDNQISSKEKELIKLSEEICICIQEKKNLETSIEENKAVISGTLATLSNREEKVKEIEEKGRKDMEVLTLAMQDVERNRKEIEEIKKSLKEREFFLDNKSGDLVSKDNLLNDRKEKLDKIEEENTRKFTSNANRASEIDKQYEEFNIEKRKLEMLKTDLVARENSLKVDLVEFQKQKDSILVKEKQIEERDRLSINREQRSMIKEEELRIREKKIFLKEQQ